jgi:hypothetical protein
MIHEQNLIIFTGSTWMWDLEKIRNCGMIGSGVDLFLEKFDLLSTECQEVRERRGAGKRNRKRGKEGREEGRRRDKSRPRRTKGGRRDEGGTKETKEGLRKEKGDEGGTK